MLVEAANKILEPAKAFIDSWPWVMDPVSEHSDEPPRDPGAGRAHHSYTDKDFEGHRAHSLYVNDNPPSATGHHRPHRSRRRHHRHHNHRDGDDDRPITPPSQRVQFILGEEDAEGSGLEPHPLFSEMETLCEVDGGQMEWKETARWVKFEEDVEEGGNRWSKPHVGTLSLHSLFELRSLILNGTVMLDMEATSLEHIADLLLDNLINSGAVTYDKREQFRGALLRRHKHLHDKNKKASDGSSVGGSVARLPLIRSLADIGRSYSNAKMLRRADTFAGAAMAENAGDIHTSPSGVSLPDANGHANGTSSTDLAKRNLQFMRKIPPGAEASNILVGEVDFLEKPVSAFIRLSTASLMGDLTEVPVPTRFIFLLLGPVGGISRYHEVGRAMATLLSDEVFHDVAYKAKNRGHLLAAVDEFLDAVTVLPPGEWDPTIRIEPPAAVPSQDPRKRPKEDEEEQDDEEEEEKYRIQSGLVRTGRLFGGLINDIKRKRPWYWSDFKDAFAMQSLASYIFLYFASLTPIVTFGGLLSDATGTQLAAIESLVSGLICGVTYGLFSGQPLTILGSTGPMLVFEQIVYQFCTTNGIDYLSFRLWVGLWIGAYLILLVATDASAYVKYITRFTEENFATLIAFIFIIKAFEKVIHIGDAHHEAPAVFLLSDNCSCLPAEDEMYANFTWPLNFTWDDVEHAKDCLLTYNGTLNGTACPDLHDKAHPLHVSDTLVHGCSDEFLMSILLFLLTFLIAINLKEFKSSPFFPNKVRSFISDFSVIIAIVMMTTVDYLAGIATPKLEVPDKFQPTWSGRTWLIPFFNGNAWWTALAAALPALLGVILVFMDQQITAVIVNRKEHKLKKGGGYHLDLFVLAVLVIVLSILGLPWFVAATVLAINHVDSLKVESETAAPGEKPQFLGVRENRVTHVLIFATIGLSVLMTPLLRMIPMPVLFGVFLYMGVSALKGLQFFDRILIMFMPAKYQPDYTFLRQVPLKRVHLFTFIQLMCLIVLWVVKSIFYTSILFPLMLVVMVGIRKLLEKIFTNSELRVLDDVLPEFSRKKKQEAHDMLEEEPDVGKLPLNESGNLEIPLASGNVMRIPLDSCNISEELNRSGVWQGINKENKQARRDDDHREDRKHRGHRRHKSTKRETSVDDANGTRLTTMPEEEEEEDGGITIKVGANHHSEDREDRL